MYQVALNSAMVIPDICCALVSDNGKTSPNLYEKWIDEFVALKYDGTITGKDIYKLRCALLHQGKLNHDYPKYKKIVFQLPSSGGTIHNGIINDALFLNIKTFCYDIIGGYTKWAEQNYNNKNVEKNYSKIVAYYSEGLPPFLEGLPVLA